MKNCDLSIWPQSAITPDEFCAKVWREGALHNRNDLPWRFINNPYEVLVSEVMLQQTQVKRVLSFWPAFLKQFPDLNSLSYAQTSDVLRLWQGLGYNRRALALKRCAEICVGHYDGLLPIENSKLRALPGIGPATAAGIRAFAHNLPGIYLETNVRTVFLHELFPNENAVSDKRLEPLVEIACPDDRPREWYYALLDYGAFLKLKTVNPSRRSSHYSRQSKFEGSHRQKRSFVLKLVLDNPGIDISSVLCQLNKLELSAGRNEVSREDVDSIVDELVSEGFFKQENGKLK